LQSSQKNDLHNGYENSPPRINVYGPLMMLMSGVEKESMEKRLFVLTHP